MGTFACLVLGSACGDLVILLCVEAQLLAYLVTHKHSKMVFRNQENKWPRVSLHFIILSHNLFKMLVNVKAVCH